MRRIVRSEAICLRVRDYHESSKLVTFFTLERGKVNCLAKGARRLRSKFGAALDIFAQSRIMYYLRETSDLYTLSDAELVHSFSGLASGPERFLAAEQMAEFVLRTIQPHDPSPQLYRLLLSYLSTIESVSPGPQPIIPGPFPTLVCSFLLKAASFLGFRPELRRCLICHRPIESSRPAYFDTGRGGIICPRCAGEHGDTGKTGTVPRVERSEVLPPVFASLIRLEPAALDTLAFLLYTPAAEIASLVQSTGSQSLVPSPQPPIPLLDLVLGFLGHHFDPLVLNSFRWHAGLERNN
jgi:DNA repair protein RecO (recombination protein O)